MSMFKPEYGRKHVCVSCAARFYDLMRAPAVCPKCSTVQPPPQSRGLAAPRGGLRGRPMVPRGMPVVGPPAAAEGPPDDEDAEDEEDEDDEDAAEDDAGDVIDDPDALKA
ncbi:FYDLN acid domain-containing protein [Limobrevibacterium gyesilva]|uniref:FYDLN acid domain-containing protein n=1 Tax=Limobrevibacterium gyesilva TaxID=2991712 RepID=A0AA41YTC8_9PROT|nr:FYDLN acid domain-containing protein [Limobrevibacterium gyesilva]MCW3476198.1 FYDLN acid domain-containing protein [Limobrevibacterium gyesilva]